MRIKEKMARERGKVMQLACCISHSFVPCLVRFCSCSFLVIVSRSMIAEKLDMTVDKAEEWIVNLIRNAKMDAKIDTTVVGYGPDSIVFSPTPLYSQLLACMCRTESVRKTCRKARCAENVDTRERERACIGDTRERGDEYVVSRKARGRKISVWVETQ